MAMIDRSMNTRMISNIIEDIRDGKLKYNADILDQMTAEDMSRIIEDIFFGVPLVTGIFVRYGGHDYGLIGLNVLASLDMFINRQTFKLTGLTYFSEFNGCSFNELGLHWKRKITEEYWNICYIDGNDDELVKTVRDRYVEMYRNLAIKVM